MRTAQFLISMILVAVSLQAAPSEISARGATKGHWLYLSEDTSAANAAITLTIKDRSRFHALRSIQVVCSATPIATLTITSKITRVGLSNPIDLGNITMSTTSTSAAQYVDIPLMPTDILEVTVPAAGVGITCSPMVIEEAK